jgi:FkbM family methyltransferase
MNKNATGTRALVVDVGLFSGDEFFHSIDHGFEVVGLEPSPVTFPNLKKKCNERPTCNVVDLDNVSLPLQREAGQSYLINAAAGNKEAVMQLMLKGPATSLTAGTRMKGEKKVDVRVVRLDDIVRDDIYILKVDTQGFDQYVIEGASELFKNHVVRQVIVEVDPFNMAFNNHTVHGFLELFQDNGMVCFQTHSDTHRHCEYFGESVEGFEKVFDGTPQKWGRWGECFEDFLCLNIEKAYPGELPGMMNK